MIITIDGRAGTGKTTVAREVAKRLGFQYVDTGAMYRAVTYLVLKEKISLDDPQALQVLLDRFTFSIQEGRYFVGTKDVTEPIRSAEVTSEVSKVSALQEVREVLVYLQRELGKKASSVFEGRDMGSVVFPNAELQIYLTATDEVCAKRRFKELAGCNTSEEHVLQELKKRNAFDEKRLHSPLKRSEKSHIIDTSDLSIEEVVQQVVAFVS